MTLPFWSSWTTCQPPRPSGIVIELASPPPAVVVGVPSGTETNVQHVPVQLTRLPTTVDHSRSTGVFGTRPCAASATRVFTVPEDDASCAVAFVDDDVLASCSVVFASSVGATLAGQSIRAFGRPLSFVTVNDITVPSPHGIGDCWMFRYLKLIASATSIVCRPTGPLARMCITAVPRVQFAMIAPTYLLSYNSDPPPS